MVLINSMMAFCEELKVATTTFAQQIMSGFFSFDYYVA